MSLELGRTSIADLFSAAASTAPTPGGGAVSAIGGYLGAALVLKAVRISAKRATEKHQLMEAESELVEISASLLQCSQRDSDSFDLYIKTLKLPKNTAQERTDRSKALANASAIATDVSIDILVLANRMIKCIDMIAPFVAQSIRADAIAGMEFGRAMAAVSIANGQSNLEMVQPDKREELHLRLTEAAKTNESAYNELSLRLRSA